jgi:DNA repair exonuclease SbcCD ATPase subunit
VIQSLLFFALGFAAASLLAVAIIPAIWRRAATLARRRVEASLPMTTEEMRAEKDRQRAEHALALRRVEIDAKSHADKAARHAIEIGRQHEAIRALTGERDDALGAVAELEIERDRLVEEVRALNEEAADLAARLDGATSRIDGLATEIAQLSEFGEEESLKASNRQIELLARESNIETLTTELAALKAERRDQDRRQRELIADNRANQEALRNERKRLAEAEKKIEKLMSGVSDRDEKLERRDRERARFRDDLKLAEAARRASDGEVAELRSEVLRLEALLSAAGAQGDPGKADVMPAAQGEEADRLAKRIAALAKENRRLRAELDAGALVPPMSWSGNGAGPEALREQIAEVAARIVDMTSRAEGPDSPVGRALAATAPAARKGAPRSLAERIGALREPAGSA